jgi:hypothetical protein
MRAQGLGSQTAERCPNWNEGAANRETPLPPLVGVHGMAQVSVRGAAPRWPSAQNGREPGAPRGVEQGVFGVRLDRKRNDGNEISISTKTHV